MRQLEQAEFARSLHGLRAFVDVELAVDPARVPLHGVTREIQLPADIVDRHRPVEQLEYLELSVRQLGLGRSRGREGLGPPR